MRAATPSDREQAHANELRPDVESYSTHDSRRPPALGYVDVAVGDLSLRGMLDSGSNGTIMGRAAYETVRNRGWAIERMRPIRVRMANGATTKLNETLKATVRLAGRKADLRFHIIPDSPLPLILGLDFILAFGIVMDYPRHVWYFGDDPSIRYSFSGGPADAIPGKACGLSMVSGTEGERLREFLARKVSPASPHPGVTSLIEHTVDVGNTKPIRQRRYLVSPKVQAAIGAEVA